MQKSIVISHYNENIDWVQNIEQDVTVYIYKKSECAINENLKKSQNCHIQVLPNIGNEQHTYFYHIVKHYNNLQDLVYFVQANPFEHCHNFWQKFNNNVVGGLSDFNLITSLYENHTGKYHTHINHKYQNVSINDILGKIFIDPWNDVSAHKNISYVFDNLPELNYTEKKDWIFNANGLYSIKKEDVYNFDLSFYKKCLCLFDKRVHKLEMTEFVFERISKFIFYKNQNL